MLAIIMLACFVTSMTLDFRNFCEDASTSVAAAMSTKLSRTMVGIFAYIAFFELGRLPQQKEQHKSISHIG